MRRVLAPIRARGGTAAVASLAAFAVLLQIAPYGLVPIPNRNFTYGLVWPLISFVWALPFLAYAQLWSRPLERTAQRSLWVGALILIASVSALALGSAVVQDHFYDNALMRNYLVIAGVALTSCALMPATAAWLPIVMVGAGVWIFGPIGQGQAHDWALFLRAGDDATGWAVAIFAVGVVTYLLRSAAADFAVEPALLRRLRNRR